MLPTRDVRNPLLRCFERKRALRRLFAELDPIAGAKVTRAIARLEQGNLSNVKSVGEGVLEYKIDFGPGYRVYFGRDGEAIIILLTGGTKKRQQRDIASAQDYWRNYRQGKSRRPG